MNHVSDEGWAALSICLINRRYLNPETAFECLALGKKPNERRVLSEEDVQDMVLFRYEMKMTWKQIADLYGASKDSVRRRIIRAVAGESA